MGRGLGVGVLALVLPAALAAQSLGEAARKERERRSGIATESTKVIDADALREGRSQAERADRPKASLAAAEGEPRSSASGSRSSETIDADAEQLEREKAEKHWRERAAQSRSRVQVAEAGLEQARSDLAAARSALAQESSPYVRHYLGDTTRATAIEGIKRATAEIEHWEKELADAREALDGLDDEARRAGALPGWLRED